MLSSIDKINIKKEREGYIDFFRTQDDDDHGLCDPYMHIIVRVGDGWM